MLKAILYVNATDSIALRKLVVAKWQSLPDGSEVVRVARTLQFVQKA